MFGNGEARSRELHAAGAVSAHCPSARRVRSSHDSADHPLGKCELDSVPGTAEKDLLTWLHRAIV